MASSTSHLPERGEEDYYVLFCCFCCDGKFGTKDDLKKHMEICRKGANLSTVKNKSRETKTVVTSVSSSCDKSCSSKTQIASVNPSTTRVTRNMPQQLAQVYDPSIKIKTEPSVSPISEWESSQQPIQANYSSVEVKTEPFVSPVSEVKSVENVPGSIRQRNRHETSVLDKVTQNQMSCQASSQRPSSPTTITPQADLVFHSRTKGKTSMLGMESSKCSKTVECTLVPAPNFDVKTAKKVSLKPGVRLLVHKDQAPVQSNLLEKVANEQPKLSKTKIAPRMSESPAKSCPSLTLPQTQAVQFQPSHAVTLIKPQQRLENTFQQQQQTVPQNVQPAQLPQFVDKVADNAQHMPTLIQSLPGVIPVPQQLLGNTPVLFQGPKSIFQSSQNVLSQSLSPQHMLIVPASQQNLFQNSVGFNMTMPTPGVNVQNGTNIQNINLTGISHSSSEAKSLCGGKSRIPSQLPQNISLPVNTPSSVQSLVQAPLQPVETKRKPFSLLPKSTPDLSQEKNGMKSPTSDLSGQQPQIMMPIKPVKYPQPPSVVWLPDGVKCNAGQTLNQLKQTSTTACHLEGGSLTQNNVILQNQSSNVVLLPPIMSQGHILNGIRMVQEPGNALPIVTENSKLAGSQKKKTPETISVIKSTSLISKSGDKILKPGRLVQTKQTPGTAGYFVDLRSKEMAPLVQGPLTFVGPAETVTTSNTNTGQKAEKSSRTSSLKLSFYVDRNDSGEPIAAEIEPVREQRVFHVAKRLLNGSIDRTNVLFFDNGKMLVPIDYTGPYRCKSTTTVKKSEVKNVHKINGMDVIHKADNNERRPKLSENLINSSSNDALKSLEVQTMRLEGEVVWLFFDGGHPKIVYKIHHPDEVVFVLPLEHELPAEAKKQVTEMLLKAKRSSLQLPPSKQQALDACLSEMLDSTSVLSKNCTSILSSNPRSLLSKNSTSLLSRNYRYLQSLVSKRNRKILPKGKIADDNLSDTLQAFVGESLSNAKLPQGTCSLASTCSSVLPSPKKNLDSQEVPDIEHKKRPKNPQITVKVDEAIVKRALEAHVKLERIQLTDEQQQQLDSMKMQTGADDESLSGKNVTCPYENTSKKIAMADSHKNRNLIHKENQVESLSKKCSLSKSKTDSSNLEQNGKIDSGLCVRKRGRKPKSSCYNESKGPKMKVDDRDTGILGRDSPELGVRRSARNSSKPKPNYWLLDNQLESFVEDFDDLCENDAHKDNRDSINQLNEDENFEPEPKKKYKYSEQSKHSAKSLGPGPISLMDHQSSEGSESDMKFVVDEVESMEMEDDSHHLVIDENQKETSEANTDTSVSIPEECKHSAESSNQSLFVLDQDYKEVIFKESGGSQDRKKGLKGHVLYLCTKCGFFQSRSKKELFVHLDQHRSGTLSCKVCDFSASSVQELEEHVALEHTGKPLYQCQICLKPFFNMKIYQIHANSHSTSVSCETCGIGFPSKVDLQSHQKRNHAHAAHSQLHKQLEKEDMVQSHCLD